MISSYQFQSHNTHCVQHCQDFITCTCFLSHEPNVSKHSQLSHGMCSQLSLDVLRTSDSRRLLRYKAHKNIEIQKNKVHDLGGKHKETFQTSLTITTTKTEKVYSTFLLFCLPFLAFLLVATFVQSQPPQKTYCCCQQVKIQLCSYQQHSVRYTDDVKQ